jgi:hypothetical protein
MKKKISDVTIITKNLFHTPTQFSQFIEELASTGKRPLMETLLDYCQKNDIDIESTNKLVSRSLKEKLRTEAIDNNLLPKANRSLM